jgi:hypothetical protein
MHRLPVIQGTNSMQLPDQLIVQWFSEPLRTWTWTPPAVPDFVSPSDLAALLTSYRAKLKEIRRQGGRPDSISGLSDSALAPLLSVAYRASFLKEEGRPVRACLYAPPKDVQDEPGDSTEWSKVGKALAVLFNRDREAATNRYLLVPPMPLDDPKHIARFAPTLVAEDAVLLVDEDRGNVVCKGITLLDWTDAENDLLHMPHGWHGDGLFVHILGPGQLRVSEGNCEYVLRANKVRVYQRAVFVDHVRDWLLELAKSFVAKCSQDGNWDPDRFGPEPQRAVVDLTILWSRVLRQGLQMDHGGAFVVVPDAAAAPIVLKYRVQPFDLGEELRQAWISLCGVWRSLEGATDRLVDLLDEKRERMHKLCSASRSIGHLSATDGCVVLDRTLTLHAFGGDIQVASDAPSKRCILVQGSTQTDRSEEEILRPFGHRHKSALNLCKQVPNSLVFVISQDGDLRLFASDESAVYLYDSLHA